MKYQNLEVLRQNLVGKRLKAIEYDGAHGMVLKFVFDDVNQIFRSPNVEMSVATYDDLQKRPSDEFYVGLNNVEL